MRRFFRALAVVGVALTVVTWDASPAAASTYVGAWSYNIAGAARWTNDALPIDALFDEFVNTPSAQRPWAISLQEVCFDQFLGAVYLFGNYNLVGAWTTTKNSVAACDGDPYGVGVLMATTTSLTTWEHQYSVQSGDDYIKSEFRRIVCKKVAVSGLFHYSACSTHLTDEDSCWTLTRTVPQQQSDEASYITYVASASDTIWVISGGDWNTPPEEKYKSSCPATGTSRALFGWYLNYEESDGYQTSTHEPTHSSGHKVDYVWMNDSYVTAAPLSPHAEYVVYLGKDVSDHALVRGRFLM